MTTATEPTSIDNILRELDRARKNGPLHDILIPPCPNLLTRLQNAMAQAEPDLNEVAQIATSDIAMSAALLRAANSPLYAVGQPAQTIGQAMNRLGLEQTAAVMTGFLAQRAIKVTSKQLLRFWERCTKRALAMSFIASKLPGVSTDLAHTYGLFCHVGMAVMAQSLRGYLSTLVEAHARIDRSFIETENANHRTDHAVVGALVARVWRLSPTVTAAIRLHHEFEVLDESRAQSEVNTLIAMGLVADYFMRRHEGLEQDVDWKGHSEAALAWLQIGGDELLAWEEELREILEAA
ncbi:MAG: HDOD domain-containing protein [Aquabacterium sp.]|nr:HDOD domain-containing protein [Aquabacterium sp.]